MRTNCGVSSKVNLPFYLRNEFFFKNLVFFFLKFDNLISGNESFTWNVFSAAITIGQLANVFAALGSSLVRCWLRVKWLGSCRQVTVDVDELLCIFNDFLWWLQCWACGTSVKKIRLSLISHAFFGILWSFIRRMSSTAGSLRNCWLIVASMLCIASVRVSARLSLEGKKNYYEFQVFTDGIELKLVPANAV